ncbi:MAG TPA: serine hydroxymethyltransferase [Streptosporangiaceae bacterium]|nr:serine hydroxymethyltransferase [Streptosporangiaceae bacterium]
MTVVPAVRPAQASFAEPDAELSAAIAAEQRRQADSLVLVASSSIAHPAVLKAMGSTSVNVTAEGYPGRRYHAGCAIVDRIERLAIERAKALFGARYANVQPHSATTANQIVMASLLRPGDTILGMSLDQGGHLSHGSPPSLSGQYFRAVGYGLDQAETIDYDQVARLAAEHRPKLIICGATAYPRTVDFARFRQIADDAGAYLLADISHIGGLVAAGLHQNPVDYAHVVTTCTHKQLYGPRGGLILIGKDAQAPAPDGRGTLEQHFQRAVFPFFQGAPAVNVIAGKAAALRLAATDGFRHLACRIAGDAAALAAELSGRSIRIVSGGTDNHIVLADLTELGLTGHQAERALEEAGIVVNKNRIPGDRRSAVDTSGIRIGTNTVAFRGLGPSEMVVCADLIAEVITAARAGLPLAREVRDKVRRSVGELCADFPIPGYAVPDYPVPGYGARP